MVLIFPFPHCMFPGKMSLRLHKESLRDLDKSASPKLGPQTMEHCGWGPSFPRVAAPRCFHVQLRSLPWDHLAQDKTLSAQTREDSRDHRRSLVFSSACLLNQLCCCSTCPNHRTPPSQTNFQRPAWPDTSQWASSSYVGESGSHIQQHQDSGG